MGFVIVPPIPWGVPHLAPCYALRMLAPPAIYRLQLDELLHAQDIERVSLYTEAASGISGLLAGSSRSLWRGESFQA